MLRSVILQGHYVKITLLQKLLNHNHHHIRDEPITHTVCTNND